MKDWIVETQVTSRRTYHVHASDEKEAIYFTTHMPPETDEDVFEETLSVVENAATAEAEAKEENGDAEAQALWRKALDAERIAPAEAEALQAGVDVERIASSLASMLIEYVDGGINSNQNWRNGFNEIIQARLRRLLPSVALSSAPAQEDGSKELGAHPRGSGQSMEGAQS